MSESTLIPIDAILQMTLEHAAITLAVILEATSLACQSAGVTEHTLAIQVIVIWGLLVGAFYVIAFSLQVINQTLLIFGRACNTLLRRISPKLGRILDAFAALVVQPKTGTLPTT